MNLAGLPNAQAVFVHDDAEAQGEAVAERIAELAAEAIAAHGVCRIALAGGETPRRCYKKLHNLAIDWAHMQLYFGDERCLPIGDTQRNDSMVRDSLLRHIAIPQSNIHRIPAELGAREAAARYTVEIGNAYPLDIVLLGMGEDGHTASLFPGNPATESAAAVVPVYNAPKPPPERVSLGMRVLNAARRKIFLVAGSGKREAIERILKGEALPAARVTSAEWHFDRTAIWENATCRSE